MRRDDKKENTCMDSSIDGKEPTSNVLILIADTNISNLNALKRIDMNFEQSNVSKLLNFGIVKF